MIKVRPILPKNQKPLRVSTYKKSVERTLNLMELRTKGLLEGAVKSWSGPPKVVVERTEFGRTLTVDSPVFRFVDEGTRAHRIIARRGRFLRFRSGYRAKSSPDSLSSGAGGAFGDSRFAREVWHPGTKPRNYTKKIQAIVDKEFPRVFSAVQAEEMR